MTTLAAPADQPAAAKPSSTSATQLANGSNTQLATDRDTQSAALHNVHGTLQPGDSEGIYRACVDVSTAVVSGSGSSSNATKPGVAGSSKHVASSQGQHGGTWAGNNTSSSSRGHAAGHWSNATAHTHPAATANLGHSTTAARHHNQQTSFPSTSTGPGGSYQAAANTGNAGPSSYRLHAHSSGVAAGSRVSYVGSAATAATVGATAAAVALAPEQVMGLSHLLDLQVCTTCGVLVVENVVAIVVNTTTI